MSTWYLISCTELEQVHYKQQKQHQLEVQGLLIWKQCFWNGTTNKTQYTINNFNKECVRKTTIFIYYARWIDLERIAKPVYFMISFFSYEYRYGKWNMLPEPTGSILREHREIFPIPFQSIYVSEHNRSTGQLIENHKGENYGAGLHCFIYPKQSIDPWQNSICELYRSWLLFSACFSFFVGCREICSYTQKEISLQK